MLINQAVAKKFYDLILDVVMQTAMVSHKYIESHNNIYGFTQYPIRHIMFPKNDPEYAELFQKIPFLIYDIPKFYTSKYPKENIDYSGIFYNLYSGDTVNCTQFDAFNELLSFVSSDSELTAIILAEDSKSDISSKLKILITDIVERYLFETNATASVPDDLTEQLKHYTLQKMFRLFSEELPILIYVPICLATFEEDEIELSDTISIIRISEDIQKARHQACAFEVTNEDWVAACATHMIVIKGYFYENSKDLSILVSTHSCNSYPLQEIEKVFASIRLVTGYSIGYEQLLTYPIGWIDRFHADLIPLYGAKSHSVNPREIEKHWMDLPVKKIKIGQIQEIQKVYHNITTCQDEKKKHTLLFALKRYNRCVLRNEEDDMATDATIGLEALLAGGTKGEITYTISNRIPVVFSHAKNNKFSNANCRAIMKKIYNYRSKIVHGGKMKDNEKFIEINRSNYSICEVAVEFLRYTLLFMSEHQEFLDATKLDEYIDSVLVAKTKDPE